MVSVDQQKGCAVRRYTREEILRESEARPEELAELEARRVIVPNRPWRIFGKRGVYYSGGQLDVLRLIVRTRRTLEAHRQWATPVLLEEQGPAD